MQFITTTWMRSHPEEQALSRDAGMVVHGFGFLESSALVASEADSLASTIPPLSPLPLLLLVSLQRCELGGVNRKAGRVGAQSKRWRT